MVLRKVNQVEAAPQQACGPHGAVSAAELLRLKAGEPCPPMSRFLQFTVFIMPCSITKTLLNRLAGLRKTAPPASPARAGFEFKFGRVVEPDAGAVEGEDNGQPDAGAVEDGTASPSANNKRKSVRFQVNDGELQCETEMEGVACDASMTFRVVHGDGVEQVRSSPAEWRSCGLPGHTQVV